MISEKYEDGKQLVDSREELNFYKGSVYWIAIIQGLNGGAIDGKYLHKLFGKLRMAKQAVRTFGSCGLFFHWLVFEDVMLRTTSLS